MSASTELEENKTSDKARNSAKTALVPIAETGIKMLTCIHIPPPASTETGGTTHSLFMFVI